MLPSIKRRLSLALIGIAIAWGVAVSLAVALVVRHEVDEVLDHGLQEVGEIIHGMLSFRRDSSTTDAPGIYPMTPHDEDLVWQLVDRGGKVTLRSHRAPAQPLSPLRDRGFDNSATGWRVFALPFGGQGAGMLYVAQSGDERAEARLEAGAYAALAALVVGVLGALLLRACLRREFDALTRTAQSIANYEPLEPGKLAPPTRAELVPINDAVADLGQRLARKLVNEQAFTAHAAHALRTPLAGLITNLALAQRRARDPEDRAVLQRTRHAANRLRRVVAALLTLFRSGGSIRSDVIDLHDLIDEMPFWSISLTVKADEAVRADPDLLAAALMNLLDNAERHGATDVTVAAGRCAPNHHEIRVTDNGNGIDPEARRRLQQAIDSSNYEGTTGLGLMLVDLVARAHAGRCSLLPSSRGFAVAFTLEDPAFVPDSPQRGFASRGDGSSSSNASNRVS